MVAAVQKAPSATPVRIITSGLAERSRATATITAAAIRLQTKAAAVVSQGLVICTAPTLEEVITPPPSTITASAAPRAAAWLMPRVKGEPSGLRRMDCMAAPAAARPAPATTLARAWGRRMFQTMVSTWRVVSRPSRVRATVASGMRAAPSDTAATRARASSRARSATKQVLAAR